MEQVPNYADLRQTSFCAYCAGKTETRDHVPSKVFLDEPYPDNLPVVPACQCCNESFSLDEQYVACLIECVINGSVKPDDVKREKIRRILERKPTLVSKFREALQETAEGKSFRVETERVRNVILKLAMGHALFELNEPQFGKPSIVNCVPLLSMAREVLEDFETPPQSSVWPEVGSRASQRLVVDEPGASLWIVAQPGRYRYLTSVGHGVLVRIVISEYLACEVAWRQDWRRGEFES